MKINLTLDQALQQAVAAHKEGKLQDAERLYRTILQSQPAHPDANHNLGVLAVSVNKSEAALPLFESAVNANPKVEQFWLSYIDALIKTERINDAKRVVADAQKARVDAAKLQIFADKLQMELSASSLLTQQELRNPQQSYQRELSEAIELREVGRYKRAQEWLYKFLQDRSDDPEALSLLSQVFLMDKKEAEAEKALIAAASINSALPSVYRNQARLLLKQSKPMKALEKAQLGCKESPEDPESLLVLASCLGANKRDLEALPIIEKILKIKSNYAEAYASRAIIKLRAKDKTGAIEDAKIAVSLKPHLAEIWFLLSSLHYQNSKLSDAIEAMRHALENDPNNAAYMTALGEFLRQDDKASEAISILKQATELAPEDANAWANLGVVFQQEKRIADAKIAYEKALALNPKSAAIASNLGAMAQEAEEWESALKYYRKVLEIDPNLAEAHNNLGNTLKGLGRLDEALASYKQAIALKPDFAGAHSNLGGTLQELGRFDEAEASLRQAVALKPDSAGAHSNLGGTLQDLGRLDEAEASLRQAIALKPDFALAHSNLGNTLKEVGRLDEAEKSCRQAIALKPDFDGAHHNLGNTLKGLGRLDEALASYKQAIALKPDSAGAHSNLGGTLQELGRFDEAEASLRQAVALKPDFAEAHSNLGGALRELGRLDEAELSYSQAIALRPDYAEAHFNLGSTLKERGRLDEAEASLRQAVALKPDFAEAHCNLGYVLFGMGDDSGALNCYQRSCDLLRGINASRNCLQETLVGISQAKLCHDIEQFEYLASRSSKKDHFSKLLSEYSKIRDETSWASATALTEVDPAFDNTLVNSSKLLHLGEAGRVKKAVNGSLDTNSICDKYFSHEFGLTYIDDFLSSDALTSLRSFLLESTIWFGQKKGGYLGAYLKEGLASPLILQIASELKSRFPLIIKNHSLNQVWAYKYDSRASDPVSDIAGINIHADFAAVNVNFWITQSEANLDPESGGMVVYNTEAPKDWSFEMYNNNLSRIRNELSKSDGGREVVPYRENRAVIFNSNLFHETDKYHFKEGYENRRINVTMLFGRREDN